MALLACTDVALFLINIWVLKFSLACFMESNFNKNATLLEAVMASGGGSS